MTLVDMDHAKWVLSSCRVCGGKLSRFKVSYDCHSTQNQAKLHSIGVSVEHDNEEVHPQRFCHGCYNICARTISANTSGKHYTPKLVRFQWEEHQDGCCGCEKDNRGSRNIKKKSPGRPRQLKYWTSLVPSRKSPHQVHSLNFD